MKIGNKVIVIALILVLMAPMIVAFTGPGLWAPVKKGESPSFNIGRAGISYTDSFYSGTVNIWRIVPTSMVYKPPKGFEFTQNLLGTRFYDTNWNRIKTVTGAVYVFFALRPMEQKAFKAFRLNIYYYDDWKGVWELCPTYTINGGTTAVCKIRAYGVFGLMFRDP